jgi:undecaprenyl pyrophosphate synthase
MEKEELKIGSSIYEWTGYSLREIKIVRETKTRWVLGRLDGEEISYQLIKDSFNPNTNTLQLYGEKYNRSSYFTIVPDHVKRQIENKKVKIRFNKFKDEFDKDCSYDGRNSLTDAMKEVLKVLEKNYTIEEKE